MKANKNKPTVQLSGADGNAFDILGRVSAALARAGYSREDRDKYFEEANAGDYDHLLRVTMRWVDVK